MRSMEFARWRVWMVLFTFVSVSSNAPEAGESFDVNSLSKPLLIAVGNDDDSAYQFARDEALRLPPDDFAALLQLLDEVGTWQSMAIHDGLKLRREKPDLAADFDDRIQKTIDNPFHRQDGSIGYNLTPGHFRKTTRGLLRTPEHDTLRFEALVTRKVQPDRFGEDDLRRGLVGLTQTDERTAQRYVALLEDVPEWIPPEDLAFNLRRLAGHSARWVDRDVPRLLKLYQTLRQDGVRLQVGAAIELIHVIAYATPAVRTPALTQIRFFELETMPKQGLQPWAVRDVDELRNKEMETTIAIRPSQDELQAMRQRGDAQEAIERLDRKLAPIEQQLQRDRKLLGAVRLWQTLEDAIAKTDAAPGGNGGGRN